MTGMKITHIYFQANPEKLGESLLQAYRPVLRPDRNPHFFARTECMKRFLEYMEQGVKGPEVWGFTSLQNIVLVNRNFTVYGDLCDAGDVIRVSKGPWVDGRGYEVSKALPERFRPWDAVIGQIGELEVAGRMVLSEFTGKSLGV